MGYYIQFSGITTNLKTPVLTFDRVVMDILPEPRLLALLGYQRYFTTNFNGVKSSVYRNMAGKDKKENIPTIKMNGVPFVIDTDSIAPNKRVVIEISYDGQPNTSESTLFADLGGLTDNLNGRLYDLKFFLGNRIVAHYNPEFKNVQDLSGNGKHATINSGTFVEDKTVMGNIISAGTFNLNNEVVRKFSLPSATKISDAKTIMNASGNFSIDASKKITTNSPFVSSNNELNILSSKISSTSSKLSSSGQLNVNGSKLIGNKTDFITDSVLNAESHVIKSGDINLKSDSKSFSEVNEIKSGSSSLLVDTEVISQQTKISSVQIDFTGYGSKSTESSKTNGGGAVMGIKTLSPDIIVSKIKSSGSTQLISRTKLSSSSIPTHVKEIQSELLVRTGIQSDTVIRRGIKSNLQTISFANTELKI